MRYPPGNKIAIIKAIRHITGASLKEAKDLSELNFPISISVPATFTKEEATKIFIEAGAVL